MKAIAPLVAAVVMVTAGNSWAADWPQWNGPDRNAISQETGLRQEWPQDGPALVWRVTGLGGGYSAPAISAGRMFGMSNRGADEVVWSLEEGDGDEQWVTRLGPAKTDGMPQGKEGPGCTPTVDGDRLYVLGAAGALACLRTDDGSIVWQRSLTEDFGGVIPTWRYNESPLVDGDQVICTPGGPEATLVALDKMTGELIWKCVVPAVEGRNDSNAGRGRGGFGRGRGGFGRRGPQSSAAYASAIAIDVDGQRQYVQLTAKALVGVAASDGKFLWQYDAPANRMGINCSTPIYHDGLLFAASAYGNGGGAVKLVANGNGNLDVQPAYFTKKMQNHHGGMIVVDGCLYGANGGNGGGFLACLDFQTGEVLWQERDAPKGSLAFADQRFYLRTENGTMILFEPNREQYVERGRFDQPDRSGSPAWTHPIIANGKLYIRDQDLLLCYDVQAK
jgi:outer membrane protein assembly factor BamB